jgi:signal transduction histidine kinase
MRRAEPSGNLVHAARVAVLATVVIGALYVAVAGGFDIVVHDRLMSQVDARLSDRLADVVRRPEEAPVPGAAGRGGAPPADRADTDLEGTPVVLWRLSAPGDVLASDPGAPALRRGAWPGGASTASARLGTAEYRLRGVPFEGGYLVAGLDLAEVHHVQALLFVGELVLGPFLLAGMFLGSLLIGRQASAPVEGARRRQLEFTADASHELRTPVSVIEAEVELALSRERAPDAYREALQRVAHEGARLRRIVDDLLWLARSDSTPPPPAEEPVDLWASALRGSQRFGSMADARRLTLSAERRGEDPPLVRAPAEWIDRLVGVLVDNACRYTPEGGRVALSVEARGSRVALVVEDDGPGIPAGERDRLFDRFHRLSDAAGGTGLGLAIADSVVRATGGRWSVGASTALGGARLEVTWHRWQRRSAGEVPVGRQPRADVGQEGDAERDADGHAGDEQPLAEPRSGNR